MDNGDYSSDYVRLHDRYQSEVAQLNKYLKEVSEENERLRNRIKELTVGMVDIATAIKKMAQHAQKKGEWKEEEDY